MNHTIKIYSLNLMAFIQLQTGCEPKIHYEFDSSKGEKYYGIFPNTEEVNKAIDDYKGTEPININLHDFLDTLKEINTRKHNIQSTIKDWN